MSEKLTTMSPSPSPEKTSTPSWSLTAGSVLIFTLVAAVFMGADRLGNRNYALFHLAAYGIVVALVCLSLWHCFRLANAKEHSVLLYLIGFFVAVAMLVRLAYVGEIVRSEDRTGIFLATDVFMSLALMLALVLVLRVSPNAQRPASADDEAKAQQEEA